MASREREEKKRGAKGNPKEPNGSQSDAKNITKQSQKDAKMKKAPPKAPFAEQERKR